MLLLSGTGQVPEFIGFKHSVTIPGETTPGPVISRRGWRLHVYAMRPGRYEASESDRSLSSPAPSPVHALPCMQASVDGAVEARRSSNARVFFV